MTPGLAALGALLLAVSISMCISVSLAASCKTESFNTEGIPTYLCLDGSGGTVNQVGIFCNPGRFRVSFSVNATRKAPELLILLDSTGAIVDSNGSIVSSKASADSPSTPFYRVTASQVGSSYIDFDSGINYLCQSNRSQLGSSLLFHYRFDCDL